MVAVSVSLVDLEPRVRRRYDLLAEVADELLRSGDLDRTEIALVEPNLLHVAEGYFLLSEAYKVERLPPSRAHERPHRTEPPKIAAFTTLATMMFRPFRFIDPAMPVQHPLTLAANQTFALSFAASVIDDDFGRLSFDMRKRLFNFLNSASVDLITQASPPDLGIKLVIPAVIPGLVPGTHPTASTRAR